MAEARQDRRVRYTIMVIRESFIKILKDKPISRITIKEICDGADVNRATFYAHYTDPYDLLHQIENDLIDGINQYLNRYDIKNTLETPVEMLEKILDYIKENAELVDILLNSNEDIQFKQKIIKVFGDQQVLPATVSRSLSKEDADYVFLYFAYGSIGVIQQWLKNGMSKPTKELAELMLRLLNNGRKAFSDH